MKLINIIKSVKNNKKISAFEARTHFGEILDEVRYQRSPFIIERHGKPIAAIVDIERFEAMEKAWSPELVEQYATWVDRAVKAIVKKYQPEKILLFGSVAKGTMREGSDIDLLIIKETEKRKIDRFDDVVLAVDRGIPVEPHIYTPTEIQKRLDLGDGFIKQILKEGKVLYEAPEH